MAIPCSTGNSLIHSAAWSRTTFQVEPNKVDDLEIIETQGKANDLEHITGAQNSGSGTQAPRHTQTPRTRKFLTHAESKQCFGMLRYL